MIKYYFARLTHASLTDIAGDSQGCVSIIIGPAFDYDGVKDIIKNHANKKLIKSEIYLAELVLAQNHDTE